MEPDPLSVLSSDLCYAAFQEPVEVTCLKGHRRALVTHRCGKKLEHTTEHECKDCGRAWPKI